jgi:hypothetical protein
VLELAEEALDEITLPVDASIDGSADEPLAGRRDVGLGAGRPDQLKQGVGIVASVGNDVPAFEAGQQLWGGAQVVRLSGCQQKANRQAILVDDGVDLGTQSSTRTADGVIFAPFLPPAACWWARTMELSIRAIDPGDLAARVSKTCTHTPARAHRLKRL